MSDELIALTPAQFAEISRVVLDSRNRSRPPAPPRMPAGEQGLYRVVALTEPTYTPKVGLECALFSYDSTGATTIYFTGTGLQGNVVLTINGTALPALSVDASQDDLRAHVADALPRGYGISVFPGIWEFAPRAQKKATITVEAEEIPDDPPNDFVAFNGTVEAVDEAWVSVMLGDEVDKVKVFEAIPYKRGAVSAGAVGLAAWNHEVGWVAIAWQCRDSSFASDEGGA